MISSLQIGSGSPEGIYRSREWVNVEMVRHKPRGQFVVADGCALPFPAGRFGTIHAIHVLEHVERRGKVDGTNYYAGHVDFLRELRRVLSPHGFAYIEVPDFVEECRAVVRAADIGADEATRVCTVGIFGKGRHAGDHHTWGFAPPYFEGLLAHAGLKCAREFEMKSGHHKQGPVLLYRCWHG